MADAPQRPSSSSSSAPILRVPLLHTGPVRAIHVLPGRLRFRVSCLLGDSSRASLAEISLRKLNGIESVQASPLTGSVLVRFAQDRIAPGLVMLALARVVGVGDDLLRRPEARVTRELKDLIGMMDLAVYDRTGGLLDFWAVLFLSLGTIGVRKLVQEGWSSWPTGVTLLWWALDLASKSREVRTRDVKADGRCERSNGC